MAAFLYQVMFEFLSCDVTRFVCCTIVSLCVAFQCDVNDVHGVMNCYVISDVTLFERLQLEGCQMNCRVSVFLQKIVRRSLRILKDWLSN